MKAVYKFKKPIFFMAFFSTIVYLTYRVFFTIPTDNILNIVFGIIILSLELLEGFFYGVYYLNILLPKKPNPRLPKIKDNEYPELDILIATINEDKELVEETIKKCLSMKYPDDKKKHIYLCDDGKRFEMKDLCKRLKINYIDRKNNKNAKAGNYNNALTKTSSPYVVVFDADMQPEPNFLLETVPYLVKDKNIGFVQTPQCFRNADIYQTRFNLENEVPHEQSYFFEEIQSSKNTINSVIYCGTNAVFRREALEEAGGFATESITEDIATGIMIESLGYKAISINKKLAFGLNVNNFDSYTKQKSRWSRGCIQTFKNYKVLGNKGLNLKQKLDYLSTIFYWTYGIRQYLYLTIPLLFPLFNIRLIKNNLLLFMILFFTSYFLKRIMVDIVEERKSSSTWNRIYETILFPSIALDIIREVFNVGNKKFYVSPKNKEKNTMTSKNLYILINHIIFFILTLIVLFLSIYKSINNGIEMYIITIIWLLSDLFYLTIAIIFDLSIEEEKEINIKNTNTYKTSSIIKVGGNFMKKKNKRKNIFLISIGIILISIFLIFGYKVMNNKSKNTIFVSSNGSLSIKENKIVNEKGKEITLRGISSHHIFWYGDLYTYDNLKTLKETWNVNTFRIALYTYPDTEGYIKNKYLKYTVKQIIEDCIDLDMYVIVDWHILDDNNPTTYEKEAIEFFDEISKEYKNSPNVLYEICNEPNGDEVDWDNTIKPYAERVIKVIRDNSPKSVVIVGTANYSKDTESVINNPLKEKNILYAVHVYMGDDLSTTSDYITLAIDKKLPIIITECAATDGSGDGKLYLNSFKNVIDHFEKNNISWIVWQLSDKEESSSTLIPKYKQQNKWLAEFKYTKEELRKKKYDINDYLTKEGKLVKELLLKYTEEGR